MICLPLSLCVFVGCNIVWPFMILSDSLVFSGREIIIKRNRERKTTSVYLYQVFGQNTKYFFITLYYYLISNHLLIIFIFFYYLISIFYLSHFIASYEISNKMNYITNSALLFNYVFISKIVAINADRFLSGIVRLWLPSSLVLDWYVSLHTRYYLCIYSIF